MDIKEYDKWVDYVENNGFKLPDIIIEMLRDYNSWNSRLMTSRWVARWGNLEGSLEIMEDTLESLMKEYKTNEYYNYESFIEQKIWALKDTSRLYWKLYKDDKKALDYINEALELLEEVDFALDFIVRGKVYETKWQILLQLGSEYEVIKDTENVITKYKYADLYKESYLYYSYFTKAEIEKKKGNIEKGLDYLKESLSYFPLKQRKDGLEKLDIIWENRHNDYEKSYTEMTKLTHFEV